ncbi:MAG: Transport permease protein [Candidatus Hydrogenedentes bacterium]|nr:Transport permease protein [Candidatus Hydrogenedentota bacterium]
MSQVIYRDTDQRRVSRVFRDLVQARELLVDLAWKDLRVRYRYAVMGFLWAVLEPVALMLILTFVFTLVFKAKTTVLGGNVDRPFAVLLLCGLVPWQFLATSLSVGTRSLIDSQNLVNKVNFPREVIPLAAVGTGLVNLVIGFAVLLVLHVALGGAIGLSVVWFPVVFGIQLVLVVGLVLLLSCGNVFFRDIGYMVGVGIVFGFYATPIFYTLDLVNKMDKTHPWLVRLYYLNPMAELIEAYRQILFECRFPDIALLVWPCVVALACLVVGVVVFRRNSALFSDHL